MKDGVEMVCRKALDLSDGLYDVIDARFVIVAAFFPLRSDADIRPRLNKLMAACL